MKLLKSLIKSVYALFMSSVFYPIILITSYTTKNACKDRHKIVWGLSPNKPITYNSRALKGKGYYSETYVDNFYSINNKDDFDYCYFPEGHPNYFHELFKRYIVYIKIISSYDIFITSFDGCFLRHTPLRFFEHHFWKAGNKKVIVWPYGSDSFVYSRMNDHTFRYGLVKSYPEAAKKDELTQKQIYYFTRYADFIVGNIPHNESCPKWDVLTIACYGVDTEEWKPDPGYDYNSKSVKIFHCPNHRDVKGSKFLIEAVRQLKDEGFNVELIIAENIKNEEVREMMKKCDIVAAQFLYGYANTEIEGMSLAKPVLSNLESDYYYQAARRYTYFNECPIVSTSPEKIKDNLAELILNPGLRKDIGNKGRRYVERYHSLEGQGKLWSTIIEKVTGNNNADVENWWKKEE